MTRLTFVVLVPAPHGAVVAERLRDALRAQEGGEVEILVPPRGGRAFIDARGEEGRALNSWWAEVVHRESQVVAVLMDERGLEESLVGLDSEFMIGVRVGSDADRYAHHPTVRVTVADDLRSLVEGVITSYPCFGAEPEEPQAAEETPPPDSDPVPADAPDEELRLLALDDSEPEAVGGGEARSDSELELPEDEIGYGDRLAGPAPASWASGPPGASGLELWLTGEEGAPVVAQPDLPIKPSPSGYVDDHQAMLGSPAGSQDTYRDQLDPLQVLGSAPGVGPQPDGAEPPGERLSRHSLFGVQASAGASVRRGLMGLIRRGGEDRQPSMPPDIATMLLAMKPSPIIVVPSLSGGVGKTTVAAAIAQVYGYALSDMTGHAALVDQNHGNPDQWGRMALPARATTVMDIMSELQLGRPLPEPPAWSERCALAVYPEAREVGAGYEPALIERFATELRARHVVVVVDLPNRLPEGTSGEATWMRLADLILLPATQDTNILENTLRFLGDRGVRGKTVVVPCIQSNLREIRGHKRVVELEEQVRRWAAAVVPIPRTEKATAATVLERSILEVDPRLREAYVELARVVLTEISQGRRERGSGS